MVQNLQFKKRAPKYDYFWPTLTSKLGYLWSFFKWFFLRQLLLNKESLSPKFRGNQNKSKKSFFWLCPLLLRRLFFCNDDKWWVYRKTITHFIDPHGRPPIGRPTMSSKWHRWWAQSNLRPNLMVPRRAKQKQTYRLI